MNQIAPATTSPSAQIDFRIAQPKFLGMGKRNEGLSIAADEKGTNVSLTTFYLVETDYRTLKPEQVAQLPDVRAGIEQVTAAYDALAKADLPAPAVDKVWPDAGDLRFSQDGIRIITKRDDHPGRAALRDAVYGLAELVRHHVPKPV